MWEGRLPLPSNNKIEYISLELRISKIGEDLLLITLSLLSVNTERKTLIVPATYPEFFGGMLNSIRVLQVAVMPPKAPRIYCSKLVKIQMKYKLDDLKVIVLLRLKINLTSRVNTKSSLIWSFKMSRTVTKLFKQCDRVI